MSDPTQLAKSARELLAGALNALQSNSHVPDELMAVADPVADAMSVLHRIERSEGKNLEGRDEALANVRAALDLLQKVTTHHPAHDTVMEKVATSLSKVHALTRITAPTEASAIPTGIPPAPAASQAPAIPRAATAPTDAVVIGKGATVQIPRDQIPAPPAGSVGPQGTAVIAPSPIAAPPPAQAFPARTPMMQPAPAPVAPPSAPVAPPSAPVAPPSAPVAPPSAPQAPPPAPSRPQAAPAAAPASAAAGAIKVELGTHSASNFYKGLGGNDVIDHGGLFVATYKIPKINSTVLLRVLLPGDLEFTAQATVQWTREASGSSEPGFGARFTQISQEGRHLVYRYTRNREPMFYDDL